MDIFNLSVRQVVEKIKNAEITSVEVCKLYIERIKKFNKRMNNFQVSVTQKLIDEVKIVYKKVNS